MKILNKFLNSHGKNASVSETLALLPGWYLLLTVVMGTTAHIELYFGAQIIIVIRYVSWATPFRTWHCYSQSVDASQQCHQGNHVALSAHFLFDDVPSYLHSLKFSSIIGKSSGTINSHSSFSFSSCLRSSANTSSSCSIT